MEKHNTPAQKFMQELADGYVPTDAELEQLAYAIHAAIVDQPIMLWLDRSFEDQADSVTRAIRCMGSDLY